MNNTQPTRPTRITEKTILMAIAGILPIALIVLAAIGAGSLLTLIGGFAVLGVISVALVWAVSSPVVKIGDIKLQHQKEANRHDEAMAEHGFLPNNGRYRQAKQIEAPKETPRQESELDPRHGLLVSLCILTIRTDKCGPNQYGPTSKRLMTADDAQTMSKGGGKFSDRKNWNDASKYGQEQHYIWEKRGGSEQGMMVDDQKCGGATVADLINKLMEHNTALRAGIDALPALNR